MPGPDGISRCDWANMLCGLYGASMGGPQVLILTSWCWWFMWLIVRHPSPITYKTVKMVVLWEVLSQVGNYWKCECRDWGFSNTRPGKCCINYRYYSMHFGEMLVSNKSIILSDISSIMWWIRWIIPASQ